MFTIRDIMTNPVLTIDPEKSVLQAAEIMKEHSLGGLPVVESEKLVGIITSRDVRINHPNRIVADSMTRTVVYCSPLDTIIDATELMEKHRIERLPVLEKGKIIGIVTNSQIGRYVGQLFDPLTGIYNSSYIYLMATRIFSEEHEISVVLLDINNFGDFNKRWGHVCGDKCLKEVARILRENIADECNYICRYGGDEFVIITLSKIHDAELLTNNIISKLSSETADLGMPITVSAGICGGQRKFSRDTDKHHIVVENLINKASLASTKAKLLNQKYIIAQ